MKASIHSKTVYKYTSDERTTLKMRSQLAVFISCK